MRRSAFSLLLEIYAGEGGDDSALFMEDMKRAYIKYANNNRISAEILYESKSSFSIGLGGKNAYGLFQH